MKVPATIGEEILRSLAIAEILPNALRWNSVDGGGNTCPALEVVGCFFWPTQKRKVHQTFWHACLKVHSHRYIYIHVCLHIDIDIHISYIILWNMKRSFKHHAIQQGLSDWTVQKMFLKPTNNMSKFRYVSILGTQKSRIFFRCGDTPSHHKILSKARHNISMVVVAVVISPLLFKMSSMHLLKLHGDFCWTIILWSLWCKRIRNWADLVTFLSCWTNWEITSLV